jgi:DUF4097 and DUF4098 domain-containing protein YvlB
VDEETLWILKMLSARKISARSADRILRALELLRKSEESHVLEPSEGKPVDTGVPGEQETSAGMPQEPQQITPTEEELLPAERAAIVIQEEVAGRIEETQEPEKVEEAAEEVVAEAEEEQEIAIIEEAGPSEITDEEQVEGGKEEEHEEIIISRDVELPAEALEPAQELQEVAEEVLEEKTHAVEPPVAEEEPPLELEAEVKGEMEPQEAAINEDARAYVGGWPAEEDTEHKAQDIAQEEETPDVESEILSLEPSFEAAQESQEVAEEVVEEVEHVPEAPVAEEEPPLELEAEVEEEMEPQEAAISEDTRAYVGGWPAEEDTEHEADITQEEEAPDVESEILSLEPSFEAAQESQEVAEEVAEEVEVGAPESPVAEEESPVAWEAEVEREIEGQHAVPEVSPAADVEITAELTPMGKIPHTPGRMGKIPHTPGRMGKIPHTPGEDEAQAPEEPAPVSPAWVETSDERSLLGDDGVGVIMDIPNGTEMVLEKPTGNVVIQGWDQPHVRAESEGNSSTVLRTEKNLKIKSESDITLYIPPAIAKISVAGGSGLIDIDKYPNEVAVDSDTGDVNIREAGEVVEASSVQGSITLEDCRGKVSLESESGNITVRKAADVRIRNVDGTIDLEKSLDDLLKDQTGAPTVVEVNVETVSGDVVLADIGGNVDVKSSYGNITMERCRGQSISVESGGVLALRDVANNVHLKGKNGDITVEDFLGEIRAKAEDAEVSLRNSGDAEIYIESDGGNISIEDCYADVHVNSGASNVRVFGGTLSFGGMGKVDLEMKSGDAYLHRRTFEDVRIVIENGNVELNMEKLSSEGSGRISVYRGNITVRVSPTFPCEVDVHAPRKKVYMELPVEVIEKGKNQLQGTLNGGGSKIELIAPNGEVRLQALSSDR